MESRVASTGADATPSVPAIARCDNCTALVSGEYCAVCGQRIEPPIRSIAALTRDAFESITHADSRLWRTLVALLVRPGRLTRDFLDNRRARYLPPFRLYLVMSVLFFLIASLLGSDELALRGEGLADVVTFAAFGYCAWYFFRAMRVVYGQSRPLTFAKYGLLAVTYLVSGIVVALATLAYSALAI